MKELSIEEKAKRYDEAIEKVKEWYSDVQIGIGFKANLEKLFPELKESEDERIRKELLNYFEHYGSTHCQGVKVADILVWLEKQGDANKEYWRGYRYGKQEILEKYAELEKQGGREEPVSEIQPKQEWSDVDRGILFRTIDDLKFLRDAISKDPKYVVSIIDIEREITWLNSLRPQNTWKPSDEQMDVLLSEVTAWTKGCPKQIILESLYNDLKKLKEE